MRGLIVASVLATSFSTAAVAQNTMRYYTFQGRDAVVTCGQGQSGSRVVRSIFKQGNGWVERDLSPTNTTWVSSGCAGWIAEQSRIVSPEEVQARLDAILNPPPPESFESIMASLHATLCADNPERPGCKRP